MVQSKTHFRVLIYSHDSFGLGHLRRCRTIAHALVEHRADVTVLILSGSPIIGNFSFCHRVDFVRVPGVIKLHDGEYTPLSLDIGLDATLAIRAEIIHHTARAYRPDLFLVDKEPLGLRGEVEDTLAMLKARGTPLVLGLRDVMDEPAHLAEEWRRKEAARALTEYYDHIWIYGLPQICNALEGIPLPPATRDKILFTGYLRRRTGDVARAVEPPFAADDGDFLLVTTGGGGDGAELIDWVLSAYEADRCLPIPSLLVLGPFMRKAMQAEFMQRAQRLERVHAITFEASLEDLMARSAGVVAMGGYNTFCEILSFDKPALLVPRTTPRLEQFIRAQRAQDLGLVRMVACDGKRDPLHMARLLRGLLSQPRPSQVRIDGLLDGLPAVQREVDGWLAPLRQPLSAAPVPAPQAC